MMSDYQQPATVNAPVNVKLQGTPADRAANVFQVALDLFRQSPEWITFFREVLGVEGVVRKAFPDSLERDAFEQTEEFAQIQQMLAKLRDRHTDVADDTEPTRVITVRLPKSLHESLKSEAHQRHTSMNKLCISKLLQIIDESLVAAD